MSEPIFKASAIGKLFSARQEVNREIEYSVSTMPLPVVKSSDKQDSLEKSRHELWLKATRNRARLDRMVREIDSALKELTEYE